MTKNVAWALVFVVSLLALRLAADEKKPTVPPVAPAEKIEPLQFTPEQIGRLTAQRQAVYNAEAALSLQREKWQSLLKDIALEQHLDLRTHTLDIVELPGNQFGFAVKPGADKK